MRTLPRLGPVRRARRTGRRGAALVEAAVVIPVMLVFLGLIMWTYRSYETKIDKQMETRANSMYYAAHACEGKVPANLSSESSNANTGGDTNKANQAGGKLRDSEKSGLNRSWNLVKVKPADTTVSGSAVEDRKRITFSRTIHAESEVACNEKVFDNQWTGLFGFIQKFAKSGGGFID